MRLLPVIGLEIHVRLKTQSKIFCRCPSVDELAPPNTAICPVCTGQPGALPALNEEAVRLGVRASIALNCRIPDEAHFDRKNYFYPDLPKGYQISQYDFPIAVDGGVELDGKRVRITRAHLEEDAAKNMHDGKTNASLIDFNRAGAPLLEIVTEPDFRSPTEAKTFLQELQLLLREIHVSDADMERGYMRCDANISLLEVDDQNRPRKPNYHPKIEIKNLNSFRAVERALAFEVRRQSDLFAKGEIPVGSTRGWNENTGETALQRLKETSSDYRYFPEPDLPALSLAKIREEERGRLPELPQAKRARFADEYGFTMEDARFLLANEGWADFAEQVMSELHETRDRKQEAPAKIARSVGSWLTNKLAGIITAKNISLADARVTAENFAEFISMVGRGDISGPNAQKLLQMMIETGADPSHIMEEHNLGQKDDPKFVAATVKRLIDENPNQAAQVKMGKHAVIKWFVGGVMKVSEGRVNPVKVEEEVKRQLGL